MKNYIILCFIAMCINGLKLPSSIQKCSKSDPNLNDCIRARAQTLIPNLGNGIKELRLPPLDPFHLTEIVIEATDSLTLKFRDVDIVGLKTAKVEGSHADLANGHGSMNISLDTVNIFGQYEVEGKILFLPISGKGAMNITIVSPTFVLDVDWDVVPNAKGIGYTVLKNPKFSYSSSREHYHLDNLFNGNEKLGAQMNMFLNENWETLSKEVRPAISVTILKISMEIINSICKSVPYDDLFLP